MPHSIQHQDTCACPVCRSRRGERSKTQLHVAYKLSGGEADWLKAQATTDESASLVAKRLLLDTMHNDNAHGAG